MKTLVVYYSFTHNNEMLAKAIQKRLGCDILRIEEIKKRTGFTILLDLIFNRKPKIRTADLDISSFDQCIFVAPIWAGKIASPLKTFLRQEKYHINHYSFLTICGGYPGQKDKLLKNLTRILEQEPGRIGELWVNDLLPKEKRNTIKYTSGYRIDEDDLISLDSKINGFLDGLEGSYSLKHPAMESV